jgi:hypothetical protein
MERDSKVQYFVAQKWAFLLARFGQHSSGTRTANNMKEASYILYMIEKHFERAFRRYLA